MMDVVEEDLIMAMFVMLGRKSRRAKQSKHRFWVRKLFLERDSHIILYSLNDREYHFRYSFINSHLFINQRELRFIAFLWE